MDANSPVIRDRAWRMWEEKGDYSDRTKRAMRGLQYAQEKYTPVQCMHCETLVSYWEDSSREEAYERGECDECFSDAHRENPHAVWETIKWLEEDQPNWSGCDYCCGPGQSLDEARNVAYRLIRLGLTSQEQKLPTLYETNREEWERKYRRNEEDYEQNEEDYEQNEE